MKRIPQWICAGIYAVLLLGLLGCAQEPVESVPTQTVSPPPTAQELYDAAGTALLAAPNRILHYTVTRTRTFLSQTYTESTAGTASYSGIGTEKLDALVQETLTYGAVSAEHTLTFCEGAAYSQISGCTFTQEMTAEAFISSQLPAVLLSSSLYQTVTAEQDAQNTVLHFSDASALEKWVPDAAAVRLTAASGTATLNASGALTSAAYTAAYTYGSTEYTLEISLKTSTPGTLDLSAVHPDHSQPLVPLEFLDAPKLLMRAAGDIFASSLLGCHITEDIYSEAIPMHRSRQSTASVSGIGNDLTAALTNTVQVTDGRNQTVSSFQSYQFSAGACTVTTDSAEPVLQPEITAEAMRTGVEDTALSGLFATGYLGGAALEDTGDTVTLHFSGNDAYSAGLSADISSILQMDFDSLAASFETTRADGYLRIDKQSGLPTAMGISFARTHMISETPYELTYTLEQTLSLLSADE